MKTTLSILFLILVSVQISLAQSTAAAVPQSEVLEVHDSTSRRIDGVELRRYRYVTANVVVTGPSSIE